MLQEAGCIQFACEIVLIVQLAEGDCSNCSIETTNQMCVIFLLKTMKISLNWTIMVGYMLKRYRIYWIT